MGAKVSGLQFHQTSGAKAADRAEGGSAIQGAGSRTDEPDQGCKHRTDGRRTGPVSEGLAWLFREVSNAFGVAKSWGVDQAQATVCDLEAVEAGNGTIRRIAETGCGQRAGRENGGQRSWSVEAGEQPGTRHRAAQCLFRLARDSEIGCWLMAQPAEPPYTDPYVRWCDRESWRQPTYVDCGVRSA